MKQPLDSSCLLHNVNSTCCPSYFESRVQLRLSPSLYLRVKSYFLVNYSPTSMLPTTFPTRAGYGGAAILAGLAVMAGAQGDTSTGLVLALVAIFVALFGVFSERAF